MARRAGPSLERSRARAATCASSTSSPRRATALEPSTRTSPIPARSQPSRARPGCWPPRSRAARRRRAGPGQARRRARYGTCEACGEPIAGRRLEAMPATRFCIEHTPADVVRGRGWLRGTSSRRFFGSLRPGRPASRRRGVGRDPVAAEAEVELWRRMSGPDRRHAVGVARRVERPARARGRRGRCWRPRCCTTSARSRAGPRHLRAGDRHRCPARSSAAIRRRSDWTRRTGIHPPGRALPAPPEARRRPAGMAGSDPLTVAWAREHHSGPDDWTVPPRSPRPCKEADDD